jgi:hypothetical protein
MIATGPGVERLGVWASTPEGGGLAGDPAFAKALERLPATRDLIVYAPEGSPALRRGEIGSAVIGVGLSDAGLALNVAAAWIGNPQVLQALTAQPASVDDLGYLPDDAFAVVRFAGDASKLQPLAQMFLGVNVTKAFSEGGFDLQALLNNLQPGAMAALSLAPNANLSSGVPELSIQSTNPFGYAHLTGVAVAKDESKVQPMLTKLMDVAPRFGAEIVQREREGHQVFLTKYSAGEGVHFAQVGPKVFFASPVPRLDALLAADGKAKGPLADPALRTALSARATTVVIDLRRLSEAVRALPPSAWGIGGFAIKQTTLRWLDATDDLTAVTAGVDAKNGALDAQLLLSLKARPR